MALPTSPNNPSTTNKQNLINYANEGGRLFATHYSYSWLYNITPFSGAATWKVKQSNPADPLTGIIDTSFPKGQAFAQWLVNVGAGAVVGNQTQIQIHVPRHDVDGVVSPTQQWITSTNPASVQHFTFNTPVGTPPANQCGRVLYSDFHVADSTASGTTFPNECGKDAPLTAPGEGAGVHAVRHSRTASSRTTRRRRPRKRDAERAAAARAATPEPAAARRAPGGAAARRAPRRVAAPAPAPPAPPLRLVGAASSAPRLRQGPRRPRLPPASTTASASAASGGGPVRAARRTRAASASEKRYSRRGDLTHVA